MNDGTKLIKEHFPDLTPSQIEKFDQLGDLYKEWNEKVNVISRKDIDQLYTRHILHSLGIAKFIQFKPMTEILDVGTGGGFPGIPLAIMFPECRFHLVDSIGKKILVVKEVAKALGLDNVVAEQVRAETIDNQYDFVVSRAVTRMSRFLGWVKNKIHKNHCNDLSNGIVYLKGGDLEEEMKEAGRKYVSKDLSDYFEDEFFETKKVVYLPFK